MLPEIAREEFSAALDRVAEEVLAEAGAGRPPVEAVSVAEALGITVAWDGRQQGRGRYVRLRSHHGGRAQATIVARPEPRPERREWGVAHEIGEHVAWRVFAVLGVDPREAPPGAREHVANQLAGRLLLPARWFAADAAACAWDLLHLKGRYGTASHELIARRMLEMPLPVIVSIFDNGSLYLRRSNVPGRVPPLSRAELACRRAVHEQNRPRHTCDGPQTIQGWPVHEEGWKREILRVELDMDSDEVW